MARKGNIEELIHCDACGEDYSATYRRCPFCGEKPGVRPPVSSVEDDEDDGYVFDGQALFDEPQESHHTRAGKGGKRLAERSSSRKRSKASSAGKGGHYDPPGPINWVRLTTFIFSLVIIIAALIIVFTVIYPKLHRNPNPAPSPSPSASQPVSPEPSDPNADPTGGPSGEPSGEPSADPNALTGLAFGRPNDYDFTLRSGESHTISLVFDPEGWEGTVTWATSDANFATVDANGKVTNVNQTSSLRRVIITATAGGQSVEAIVYCRAADSSPTAPPVVTSPDPDPSTPSSGTLTPGTTGVITGADGGLRVRSGPGTGYSVQASLVNGNKVTVEEDAGDGWYKISYSGSGGVTYTGYIMGEYISPSN